MPEPAEIPAYLRSAFGERYDLARELGRGGMATVYLARDLRHDRPVALKVLHEELARSLGAARFLREIRVTSRLQHPNILTVFDSGDIAGVPGAGPWLWYTMPFVDGESLRQRLAREAQLPLPDAIAITVQIAEALGYAHRQGIIHRDIKPENILLAGERCLLADFGVARAVSAAADERLTETGIALGTPAYMSPEQAVADKELDARSDVYSLGCVLFEMLIGETPFTGRTAQAIVARRMTEAVPRMRTVRDVPEEVELVVARALARAPADRFADAPAFASALLGAAQASASPSAARAAQRRRSWRVEAASILVALAAGTLAFGFYRTRAPSTEGAVDPNLLAVVPFDVLDPSLQLWREGLVDVLAGDIDGAGPLRTVPQATVLRRWTGPADRAAATTLGTRTGAGLVLFGRVLRQGTDSVALRATLIDRSGVGASSDLEVVGPESRIGQLADSLGMSLLRVLARSRTIGSVRHTSIGSRSLPALKMFLRGEQHYRRGEWDSALAHYDRAIAQDSTFAMANRRMGLVLSWNPPTAVAYRPAEEFAGRAFALNHGLAPKDSLLIAADSAAFAAGTATDAESLVQLAFRARRTLDEAVRRFPLDPEAWYQLGESRNHSLGPLESEPRRTFEAFSRAIELDSGFGPAYKHLMQLTVNLGRPDLARFFAERYLTLEPAAENASDIRLALRLMDSSRALLPETARWLDTASIHTLFNVGIEHLGAWSDTGETAVRVLRALGRGRRSAGGDAPWVLDTLMWNQYLAGALAYRGHLRDAWTADRSLLMDGGASPFSGFFDPFLTLSLLNVVPDSIARRTFAQALAPDASWGDQFTPRYLRGLPWWLQRRDTASLARFVARAAATRGRASNPYVPLRVRLLGGTAQAFLQLARGDSAAALRTMQAIPDTLCLASDFAPNCFHLYRTLALVLAARGEPRRASDLLERWRWKVGSSPAFVLATLEAGRLAEQLGRRQDAIERFTLVTDVWARPDPELMPYVEEAREAVRRLSGPR
jgi:serine/threonine-protein kinase